jgi:hypothetical protein
MRKGLLLVAACALLSLVVAQGAAAAPVTCTGLFSGTAKDLVVPGGVTCVLVGATITHDVTVQPDGNLGAGGGTTIGHDLVATQADEIVAGNFGPLTVGHDLVISGIDASPTLIRGYEVCDTTINHDLKITGTLSDFPMNVGDVGPGEFCSSRDPGAEPNTIGHDAVINGNTVTGFVPNIDVGNNSIGHDLNVSGNTATGYIDVSDNTVGHDASCSANTPALSKDGGEDGPNSAGHNNTCG